MKFLTDEQEQLAKYYLREAPMQTIAPFVVDKLGEIAVLMNGELSLSRISEIDGKRYQLKLAVTAREITNTQEKC
jgi:hypothetical protein